MKIRIKKNNQNIKFKHVKLETIGYKKFYSKFMIKITKKFLIIFLISLWLCLIIISIIIIYSQTVFSNITNFDYGNYEKDIITENMIQTASWNITNKEAFNQWYNSKTQTKKMFRNRSRQRKFISFNIKCNKRHKKFFPGFNRSPSPCSRCKL